jgi:hypothetical protein
MIQKSIQSIRKKHKDEWVLLSDFETDEFEEPVSGVVVAHSKNRGEIYAQLQQLREKGSLCIRFMGNIPPKGVAVMFYEEI